MRTPARIGFLLLLCPIAGLAQEIDMSNDSITCTTVNGTAPIAPLVTGGTAKSTTMTVRARVAGCTVAGLNAVSIRSGRLSGKLVSPSNNCVTLMEPVTGTLTMKWKADKRTPIAQRSSKMNVTNVSFGVFTAPWGTSYGEFSLGVSGVTGAFTGGDGGGTSSNVSVTSQDIGEILAECSSSTGLKTLYTGLGRITLR